VLTVALLTAFATSVHNGALKPPAVFSATFGTPWTLAGVVGHAIEAYVEMLENMFLVYDVGCFGLNHGIHRIFFYTDRKAYHCNLRMVCFNHASRRNSVQGGN
jgi:hypothetical protein